MQELLNYTYNISKKQQNRFRFSEIATLICNVPKVGIARLVVGYRIRDDEYIDMQLLIIKHKIKQVSLISDPQSQLTNRLVLSCCKDKAYF